MHNLIMGDVLITLNVLYACHNGIDILHTYLVVVTFVEH
jgi:hypothetical protein